MANTLTNLKHTILVDAALEAFTAAFAPIRAFAHNFSAEAAQKGDKVRVPFVSAQDAAIDFAGTYTIQDADMEGLDITIDKHKFVSFGLTDIEISTMPQLNLERFGRQKGFQLAKAVYQDILSVVTENNYGNTSDDKITSSAANFDADDVVDLSTLCDNDDWPDLERSLILTPAYHAAIRKDLKDASEFGSDTVIRRGLVPSLDTFGSVYKTSLVPTNSQSLVGFAAHPDAILTAMRYLQPQEGHKYSTATPVVDADSGITLGFREWYNEDTGTAKRVLEANYGFLKGNGKAIKRITSA